MSEWTRDLAGTWTCRLDPDGVGEVEQWFRGPLLAEHAVTLPGSVQEQGIGDEVTLDTPWVGNIVDRSFFEDESRGRWLPQLSVGPSPGCCL